MKIGGHPLHVMLIHFPTALFPMDLVCASIGYFTGNTVFYYAAFFALAGGVMLGWLAVITGMLDFAGVVREQALNLKKALIHGSINSTVLITYTVLAFIVFKKYPEITPAHLPLLILKAVLVAALLVGNYMGGSLVFGTDKTNTNMKGRD